MPRPPCGDGAIAARHQHGVIHEPTNEPARQPDVTRHSSPGTAHHNGALAPPRQFDSRIGLTPIPRTSTIHSDLSYVPRFRSSPSRLGLGSTGRTRRNVWYIAQSMSEYQTFANEVRHRVERALRWIGMPAAAHVVLVGFTLDGDDRHQIRVEHTDDCLSIDHLRTVTDQIDELFNAVPGSRQFYGDPRLYELPRHVVNLRRSRADALVAAVEASDVFDGVTFFASASTPRDGYEWHTCVGIPTEILTSAPILEGQSGEQRHVGYSLQHEVIRECLRRADRGLALQHPGEYLYSRDLPEDVVRFAADQLTERMLQGVAQVNYSLLFTLANAVTSLTYERAAASGRLVVASRNKVISLLSVRFAQPILLTARLVRKLLQLSDLQMAVLTDGLKVYGLGEWDSAPDVVEVSVCGHAEWNLKVGGTDYLRVAYGNATLPKPLVNYDDLDRNAHQTVGPIDLCRIRQIIEKARYSGHGMTLVISDDAAGEAERLGGAAVPIELDNNLGLDDIVRFGRVDGAVVLDRDGHCHAFGVILDGKADESGDPARGSRYNSAIRYQKDTESLIIVISDDGTVDLIP